MLDNPPVKISENGNGKVDPRTVVFAPCGTCTNDIQRAQKRKLLNGKWHHAECVQPVLNAEASSLINQLQAVFAAQNGGANMEEVEALIEKRIAEANLPTRIEVVRPDSPAPIVIEIAHERIPDLLYHVGKREHVYLHGAPGSGKSTTSRQVSESLNLSFGFTSLNPQTPESRLLGYMDANGVYRETVFFQLYRDGGVFCIDEMDNASPALLTTLNSLLENGHGAFPHGIFPRHPDFVLVACGNTNGRGACPAFPERRAFDAAFMERFVYLKWDYDKQLEKKIALSINPESKAWLEYIWELRDYCGKHYPRLVVSPRATFKGASALKDRIDPAEILERVLWKGFDTDSVKAILKENPIPDGL